MPGLVRKAALACLLSGNELTLILGELSARFGSEGSGKWYSYLLGERHDEKEKVILGRARAVPSIRPNWSLSRHIPGIAHLILDGAGHVSLAFASIAR